MTFFKNIGHDLVEKKLWPVALALVAALIAVPFLLSGGSSSPAAPVAATPATGAASGRAAVSLDTTASSGAFARGGKVRDPFKQPKGAAAPKPAATGGQSGRSTSTSTSTGGAGASGTSTPGAGGAGGSGGTTPATPAPKSATKPDSLDTFRLTLRFGQAGNLRTMRDLARLSPLPSANTPFFVYLGVLKDGVTAVFLISSDVTATGDGHCRPSPSDCQTVEVKEGDTEFFDLEHNGKPVQYEMDILHIDRTSADQKQVTAAAARAAAMRHSVAGAAMLRTKHADGAAGFQGTDGYRWLPDRGTLARIPARAHAASAGAAAAAARKPLPGLPVWHAELTV